jgi:ribonuclease P protein component
LNRKFTLGKHERLKSRKAISALFSKGKKLTISPLLAYYTLLRIEKDNDKTVPVLMGAGVGNKYFKNAVDRNRIKRCIRESYRLQSIQIKSLLLEKGWQLHVFFIFTAKEISQLTNITAKMNLILQQLESMITDHA